MKKTPKDEDATVPEVDEPVTDTETMEEKPALEIQETTDVPPSKNKFRRVVNGFMKRKKLAIPAVLIVILLIVLAVPFTRYKALGLVIKKTVIVEVVDNITGTPISDAEVEMAGKLLTTNERGEARFAAIGVGDRQIRVAKKYYTTSTSLVRVPLGKMPITDIRLVATGRQVPVTVTNKITGAPVANATISAADTKTSTNEKGEAVLVVPANLATAKAVITSEGYNQTEVQIAVNQGDSAKNKFTITPSGKIYFLSKLSGKIDVVKTNLDGTDRKTVYAGTGNEVETDTILLASTNWQHLVLKSRRESDKSKLYLIETASDKVTVIDEGDANFEPVGWYDEYFAYVVYRNNKNNWQPGVSSIKSYNAETGKLVTLDSTDGAGSSNQTAQYETYLNRGTRFIDDKLVFAKNWYQYPGYLNVPGRQNTLQSIKLDGSDKKTHTSLDAGTVSYVGSIVTHTPEELYVQVSRNNYTVINYYTLDAAGKFAEKSLLKSDDFFKTYPTYLISPSEKQTFWSEERDGKRTLFLGDDKGANDSEIAALSEYKQYGWYSDDYLLMSKNGSELYIMPAKGKNAKALKITDYHKPSIEFLGYGGGYGGL